MSVFSRSTKTLRNNKKGFTMVELLAAIVILGILSVTAIVSVTRLITKSKGEQRVQQEKTAIMATQSYFQANKDELPKAIGESRTIPLTKLKSTNYLKNNIKNADGKSCMENSYVKVYKKSNSDYTYTAHIICPGDTPTNEEQTDNEPEISISFEGEKNAEGNLQNVATAFLVIDITGGNKSETIIDGYSYSLSVQTKGDSYLREVYNSGSLKGNGKTTIHIKKPITDYIDITDLTLVKAKVVARNADGGYVSNEESISATETSESESVSYHDQTSPTCYDIQQADPDKWINVNGDENHNHRRTISVQCTDGEGSGCIRDKFYRTWPNDVQKEAEWAYIQIRDNAGNPNIDDNFFTESDPCKPAFIEDSCRVRVNVDVTHPVLDEIHAYKKGAGDSIATGATDLITAADIVDQTGNSSTKKFQIANNAYDAIKNNEYWFNNSYENGVIFQIKIHDNLHLDSWKWEVNEPYQVNDNSSGYSNLGSSVASENKSQTFPASIENSNCGQLSTTILISFQDEGLRQGRLTVKDRAGNTTVLTIYAKIDRTAPDKPSITYKKYNKSNSAVGIETYVPGSWSTVYVRASANAVEDKYATKKGTRSTLTGDLSGFKTFQYKGTKHGGGEIAQTNGGYLDFNNNLQGKNTVQFRACDKAGNCSGYSDSKEVWVDTVAPTATVISKSGSTVVANNVVANNGNRNVSIATNAYNKSSSVTLVGGWMNDSNFPNGVSYEVTMTDNVNLKSYQWAAGKNGENDSNTNINKTSLEKTFNLKAEGRRKGELVVKDEAGNSIKVTANALIDRTVPSVPTIDNSSGGNGNWTNKNVYLTLKSTDPKGSGMVGEEVSGIGKYQWKYRSTDWYNYDNSSSTEFRTGPYTAERNEPAFQRACDKAGNCSGSSQTNIMIDKTAPRVYDYHYFSHTSGSNAVTSKCSDTPKTVNGYNAASGVCESCGNNVTQYMAWGYSGTLYNTCRDNAGNSSTASRYMGYDSCFYGHPAYWDGGYCSWDAYHTWHEQGDCKCCEELNSGDICSWISGTTSQNSCFWACSAKYGLDTEWNAVYYSNGYYTGAYVWSDYCVYHENTCQGGYA